MWEDAVQEFLKRYSGITFQHCSDVLRDFADWYRATCGGSPDLHLLTVRRLKVASVNLCLSAVRSLLCHIGREVQVQGVRQEKPFVDALDGRELGRLLAALEGKDWISRRNQAMVALIDGAGEPVGLWGAGAEAGGRGNEQPLWLGAGAEGEGNKEWRVPLSAEAWQALRAYL